MRVEVRGWKASERRVPPHPKESPVRRFPLVLSLVIALVAALALPAPSPAGGSSAHASEVTASPDPTPGGAVKRGVTALRALPSTAEIDIGIATFPDRAPDADDARRLESLGLEVQLMRNLPMAIVRGDISAMIGAVERGYAYDVYPNERFETHDRASSAAMGAPEVWDELGFDGSGVGIAVIDTGVDATHADLENRVTHNIKIVGSEYAESYDDTFSIVVPVDEGPYNNADTSGHGTHVAGIVAADGSGDPDLLGVAPGADIIGYGAGDILFLFTVIASFDHVLEHHEEWNIKATNNSWGSSARPFDPLHPINLATKALHDAGVATVFSAGNSYDEMQLNPWSLAPWVISVGSTTLATERSGFSSRGLMYDNSLPVELPEDGHVRFEGDRIGVYNPDVSAPGSDIVSAGTPTGVGVLSPTEPNGSTSLSGTSMSAPHVAGLIALLLEANPDLTPDQLKQVMQVTATQPRDGSMFWETGYGFVDAPAAVELVTSNRFRNAPEATLRVLQRQADRDVLAAREHAVLTSDHYWFEPTLPASVGGAHTEEFTFEVAQATDAIRVTTAFAADLGLVGLNMLADWRLTLYDAEGTELGVSDISSGDSGHSWLQVAFDELDDEPVFGDWTLEVSGDFAVTDGVWYNPQVWVAVAHLEAQEAQTDEVEFEPGEQVALHFASGGDDAEAGASGESMTAASSPSTADSPAVAPSPEGCTFTEDGVAGGTLTASAPGEDDDCEAGFAGYAWNYGADIPVEFTSAPLTETVTIGGEATITTFLAETTQPIWSAAFATTQSYSLTAVGPDGDEIQISGGDLPETPEIGPTAERGEQTFEVHPTEIPAGYELRLQMRFTGFYTSAMRMLYGGGDFTDAALTLTTAADGPGAAAFGPGDGDDTDDVAGDDAAVLGAAGGDLPATGAPAWALLALALMLGAVGLRTRLDRTS